MREVVWIFADILEYFQKLGKLPVIQVLFAVLVDSQYTAPSSSFSKGFHDVVRPVVDENHNVLDDRVLGPISLAVVGVEVVGIDLPDQFYALFFLFFDFSRIVRVVCTAVRVATDFDPVSEIRHRVNHHDGFLLEFLAAGERLWR